MLEEFGSIVELKGKHVAVVLCKKSSFCKNCASMESCHVSDDNQSMLIEAHNALGAKVGDKVKVVTSTKSFLQSSFLLYIVPLIALLFGGIAGSQVGQHLQDGPDPNLLAAIIGVAFFVGSFFVIRVGSRALPKENFMPRITNIIPDDEAYQEALKNEY
jgi:sigma-E factor negative regulatory protein RseC